MSIEDLTGTVVRKICMACSREFHGSGPTCPHDGNMLVPLPQDPYVGRRIADKYHVLSVLGTGGMGVVYLARHETMQCNVAIKMLRAQFVGDQTSVKRFTQEAIAARRLQHPNVITTYDHGFTAQGQPYIVMDCLQGHSLADEIKRLKQLSVERVIHIFEQACDALDHAHKQGVIHRDLKPGNLMLINYNDDPDFVKVVDFGVAKIMPINNEESQTLTQSGEVCGSPVYMSPEQCLGQPLDRRADVYSMGIVIYEALTGKLPLIGKNMVDTMSKHINENPPSFKEVRPDLYIPERLEQVVMRALCKNPAGRQQSMAALKQDLMFSVPRPGQTPSLRSYSSEILPSETPPKKSWLIPAIGGAVAAVALCLAAIFFLVLKPAGQKPAEAIAPARSTPALSTPGLSTPAVPKPATAASSSAAPITAGTPVSATGTPVAATSVSATPVSVPAASIAAASKAPVPITKPLSLPHQESVRPQVPVHRQAPPRRVAQAKPRSSGGHKESTASSAQAKSADPFAALSNQRTYIKNR